MYTLLETTPLLGNNIHRNNLSIKAATLDSCRPKNVTKMDGRDYEILIRELCGGGFLSAVVKPRTIYAITSLKFISKHAVA